MVFGAGSGTRDQKRRRIQPHGLVDHGAGEFQPLDIRRVIDGRALHLGRQLLLFCGSSASR